MQKKSLLCKNKKAYFNYFLEQEYEVGVVLKSTEVKAIRDGKVSIQDAYAVFKDRELYLVRSYIGEYKNSFVDKHDFYRERKLLLHKHQLNTLFGKSKLKGYSIVPCVMYFNVRNKVKLVIALAKGKKLYDKRQVLKEREWQRRGKKNMLG